MTTSNIFLKYDQKKSLVQYVILTLLITIAVTGCDSISNREESKDQSPRFTIMPPDSTGVYFSNTMVNDQEVMLTFEYRFNGAGVGIGDINNDGLDDLFFTGTNLDNKLYLNQGDMKFRDISEQAGIRKREGVSTGVSLVDINCDGFLDIYVCRTGKFPDAYRANLLYINNGDLTFTESGTQYGIDDVSFSNQGIFFDSDNDNDLDLYIVNQPIEYTYANTILLESDTGRYLVSDRFYVNNGDGTFSERTLNAGMVNKAFGFNASIEDFNDDGFWDVYVTNDYLQPDYLYINNGDNTFSESLSDYMKHCPNSSMGSYVADYNNDGYPDVFVLDMMAEDNERQKLLRGPMDYDDFYLSSENGAYYQYMRNQLQLNNGNGTFSEIGELAGVSNTDWSWGPLLADFDNDGWKDLFVANGYRRDLTNLDYVNYFLDSINKVGGIGIFKSMADMFNSLPETPVENYMFSNNRDLTFKNVSSEWGMTNRSFSNGAAYSDLDNDGDLDIVVNNIDQVATIYRNETVQTDSSNFISVLLKGGGCNTQGVGARIRVKSGPVSQVTTYFPAQGYFSSMGNRIITGLGDAGTCDVTVEWPNGRIQEFNNVASGSNLIADVTQSVPATESDEILPDLIFSDISVSSGIDFVHRENYFIDYKREPLLPMKFSEMGPCLSSGDVNGDGLADVHIGGAASFPGAVYVQRSAGKFAKINSSALINDKDYEDVGSTFFDADNDGDLDLYVASGGNEWEEGSNMFQDRLYFNDGKGNFTRDPDALPMIGYSTSCVSSADIDLDGDADLFVGGRIIAWKYPLSPRSYILINENGKFSDRTSEICPELMNPGLVCNSTWTDFNNDEKPDLVVTGQWMPVSFFMNDGEKLVPVQDESFKKNSKGWWNSIAVGDFDNDGDTDYVVGNRGLNSRVKATPEEPARVYANDFDSNGTMDAIMTYYIQGESYPIHGRDQLTDQIRELKKKFLRYRDYTNATMYDIYPAALVDSSLILEASTFATSYIRNDGNGKFQIVPLPIWAQFSTVNGIVVKDLNGDGNLDLILAGNDYSTDVETGRYDASIGAVFFGDGNGNFEYSSVNEHGFFADDHVRNMVMLDDENGGVIVIANNNGHARVIRWDREKGKTVQ